MVIYKTTNLINGKFYIGQDFNNDSKYYGSGKLLTMAIKKYGKENFKKEILEYCSSEKELDDREIYWISKLNATNRDIAYNICEGGRSYRTMKGENNVRFGKTHTEEAKAIIREKRKLQKMTDEQKQKLREKWLGPDNPGRNKSPETIEKIKKSRKGKCRGEEHGMYGKKHSDETKKHWSEIRKGQQSGSTCPVAMRYYVEFPDGEIKTFECRDSVTKKLGCSLGFFVSKKYKDYKLIKKERINKKKK